MRTRTLIVLVLVMAAAVFTSWVVLADGGGAIHGWLLSLHGRQPSH